MSAVMMRSDCSPVPFQTMTENLRAIIQDIDYMLDEMRRGNFCINTREEARMSGGSTDVSWIRYGVSTGHSATLRQTMARPIMSFLGQSRHL